MSLETCPQPRKRLKFLIHSMDGAGHLNSAIGLAHILADRGHSVTFVMNELYRGRFSSQGFGEILLHSSKQQTEAKEEEESSKPENPSKITAEQLRKNGLLSGRSSYEKMEQHNVGERSFIATLCDKLAEFDTQIEEAIQQVQPDVIVVNQFLTPPAILRHSNVPWIYQYPCNALAIYSSERLPPFYSGYPMDSDPKTWIKFRLYQEGEYIPRFERHQSILNAKCGYVPERDLLYRPQGSGYFAKSPFLNLYDTPVELDYDHIECGVNQPGNCIRFESFYSRRYQENSSFKIPENFLKLDQKLIYLSLGSMGAIDVELMRKIVHILGKTSHRYIVSKGLRADEYELPENCWGEAFLPQTEILPLVDLVITHGGNNTVTETFSFGKPMIVMPLFFDQYDNAQRIQELGLGIRLEPYHFTEDQLIESIERLLSDAQLYQRLDKIADRINSPEGNADACGKIELAIEQFQSGKCRKNVD